MHRVAGSEARQPSQSRCVGPWLLHRAGRERHGVRRPLKYEVNPGIGAIRIRREAWRPSRLNGATAKIIVYL